MTIDSWLKTASQMLLSADIRTARLDALILLEHVLGTNRAIVLAHPERELTTQQQECLDQLLAERAAHKPLAYIRGFVDFYGLRFAVTPDVLIPRPETEAVIDLLLSLPCKKGATLIDVGTGSGCIGIAAMHNMLCIEHLHLVDTEVAALKVAAKNAKTHNTPVTLHNSSLLDDFTTSSFADFIVANLPYVSPDYRVSEAAKHEPATALFAPDDGYALIEQLIPQAARVLKPNGFLLLEMDPWQKPRVIGFAAQFGLALSAENQFHICLKQA